MSNNRFDIQVKCRLSFLQANAEKPDGGSAFSVSQYSDGEKYGSIPTWEGAIEFNASLYCLNNYFGDNLETDRFFSGRGATAGFWTIHDIVSLAINEGWEADDITDELSRIERGEFDQWGSWKLKILLPDNERWKIKQGRRMLDEDHYQQLPDAWKLFELYKGSVMDPSSPTFNFPHVSLSDSSMIAFTEDNEKGMRGIQLRIKPGKYIHRFFFDDLCKIHGENKANAIIAKMAAEFGSHTGDHGVKFAKTPDEIQHVYENGPSSCMSHGSDDYSSPEHPVRVLGAGDLEVAYLQRGRRITARTLVWPEKKSMVRTYGDAHRIEPLLGELGYRYQDHGCWIGARLLKIQDGDDNYVVPYIDGHTQAVDEGDFLRIAKKGFICLSNTNGLSEGGEDCEDCGETHHRHNTYEFEDKRLCSACLQKVGYHCGALGGVYSREKHPPIEMRGGELWSPEGFKQYGFTCAKTGLRDHVHSQVTMYNGEIWGSWAASRYGIRGDDRLWYPKEKWAEIEAQQKIEREKKAQELKEQIWLKQHPELAGLKGEDLRKARAAAMRREQRAAKKAKDAIIAGRTVHKVGEVRLGDLPPGSLVEEKNGDIYIKDENHHWDRVYHPMEAPKPMKVDLSITVPTNTHYTYR